MSTTHNSNYLIQSNFFNQTVLSDISEIQKDIIYFLQHQIDFREKEPTGDIYFDYEAFLKYKKVKRNDTYNPKDIVKFCKEMITLNGVIYNIQTQNIEFFTIIDKVSMNPVSPENFTVSLASWGKIFFYEKFAKEYAKESKIQYTQLEKNIIDLKGEKRRKLYELICQFKATGIYNVSLEELRAKLGFSLYEYDSSEYIPENVRSEKQLRLLFEDKQPTKEVLSSWRSFKQVFLDPAVASINERDDLDIRKLSYETTKKGRKIVGLVFTFHRRVIVELLCEEDKRTLKFFTDLGLNEKQVLFLLQRLGSKKMMERSEKMMAFNPDINKKESPNYNRRAWFERENGVEIKNTGGYLYDKVFSELRS